MNKTMQLGMMVKTWDNETGKVEHVNGAWIGVRIGNKVWEYRAAQLTRS